MRSAGVAAAALSIGLVAGCGSATDPAGGAAASSPGASAASAASGDAAGPQAAGYTSVAAGTPVQVLDPAGVLLGASDAPVTIDAYEDFLCPACAQFEKIYGARVDDAIDEATLAVRYHMLNFLDRGSSSGDYSTRAIGASICVARTGDGALYSAFHSALYGAQVQPVEHGSTDLTNAQLADVAAQVGADEGTAQCIADGARTDEAGDRAYRSMMDLGDVTGGQVSTPTIMDGARKVNLNDPEWLAGITGR